MIKTNVSFINSTIEILSVFIALTNKPSHGNNQISQIYDSRRDLQVNSGQLESSDCKNIYHFNVKIYDQASLCNQSLI